MFDYIFGKVEYVNEDGIVVDVRGLGYRINTSANTIFQVKKGEELKIFTQLIIKEDEASIYGFVTRDELRMFKLLLSVSGVGPKAALSLLSASKVMELSHAIITNDIKRLTVAQGIGKKTAERIVLELKDKVKAEDVIAKGEDVTFGSEISEVVEALISLGYNYSDAVAAVNGLSDKNKKTGILIKEALRALSSK